VTDDLLALLEAVRPHDGYVQFTITGSSCIVTTKSAGKPWNAVTSGKCPLDAVRRHVHESPKAAHERGKTYGQQHPSHLAVFDR
jgi:hypothetical protein